MGLCLYKMRLQPKSLDESYVVSMTWKALFEEGGGEWVVGGFKRNLVF